MFYALYCSSQLCGETGRKENFCSIIGSGVYIRAVRSVSKSFIVEFSSSSAGAPVSEMGIISTNTPRKLCRWSVGT